MPKINYKFNNYCKACELVLPKEKTRCPDCGFKIRTGPRASTVKKIQHIDHPAAMT